MGILRGSWLWVAALILHGCNGELSSSLIPSLASSVSTPVLPINPPSNPIHTPTPVPPSLPTPTATPITSTPVGNTGSAASYFPSNLYFNQSIANAAIDSQSSIVLNQLIANGGWGNNNRFQIDFSIDVYFTDANTAHLPLQDNGLYAPDSDTPASIPVAPAGGTQGFESGYGRTCDGGDCHYLAMDLTNHELVENWRADDVTSSHFGSDGGLVVWPFSKTWLPNFRGDACTSADAGGLMIAPMLFTAEEIMAGAINHAIRFILPNARIANRTYVRPATHTTGGSGWASASAGVPYGARLRLKSTYDLSTLPSPGARTVAQALKTYGMILADGGNILITAKSDAHSTAKYAGYLTAQDLQALHVSDFDMVEGGTRYTPSSLDCVRNP